MSDHGAMVGIQARRSALDPDACVLRVMRSALLGAPLTFRPDDIDRPLVTALSALDGVDAAALAGDVVSLRKSAGAEWDNLLPEAAAIVRRHLVDLPSDERSVIEARPAEPPSDSDVLAAVQGLLDRRFNPAIARHRGQIRLHGFADGVLSVEMLGGCKGCAASTLTLRHGLATLLRAAVPEVLDVVDVTDHAGGDDPFYRPT